MHFPPTPWQVGDRAIVTLYGMKYWATVHQVTTNIVVQLDTGYFYAVVSSQLELPTHSYGDKKRTYTIQSNN